METKIRKERVSVPLNWIWVDILIDYVKMQVSIIDRQWEKKNYMFCERWISYQQWWYNVVDAMKNAMEYWFTKLRLRQEELDNEHLEQLKLLADME
jgi:hypothetical protein